ncbi:MAG TPA: aminoacyl-tRNA hydrolase [Actinomycetota bacterium]|jgi:peptidyl-tRNA hydrolase, PTH1 family|nr:aminoacyl-tRNA hydrolase [Actinomycetota bacterium]
MTWLVAGLGNPGPEYATTRHNVGQMAVDVLASRAEAKFRRLRPAPIEAAEYKEGAERVILARSTQFMNESGPGFASVAKKNHLAPHQVIAVHDEIDLPFGRLQVKRGGSTAGHHGLDSLVEGLRSMDFFRIRVGVGRPPGRQDPADYVLEAFAKKEQADADVLVQDAADAVVALIRDGLNSAQEQFNRGPRR